MDEDINISDDLFDLAASDMDTSFDLDYSDDAFSDIPESIPEDISENYDSGIDEVDKMSQDYYLDEDFDDLDEDSFNEEDFSDVKIIDEEEETELNEDVDFSLAEAEEMITDADNEEEYEAQKVLKRDDTDLLNSGNEAINRRLEVQEDDYRDKGLSEEEIAKSLADDKLNFRQEFLQDAFPGQDVSPDVFNGFYENNSKESILEDKQNELSEDTTDEEETGGVILDDTTENYDFGIDEADKMSRDYYLDEDFDDLNEDSFNEDDFSDVKMIDEDTDVDGTDWERTSLTPEQEEQISQMNENGEIDINTTNPNLTEPEWKTNHLPLDSGEFLGERGNSPFRPNSSEALNEMKKYGKDTVDYKDGQVDFSPFSKHDSPWGKLDCEVEIGHMTDQRTNPKWEYGDRPKGAGHDPRYDLGNFAQADNALLERMKEMYSDASLEDVKNFKEQNQLTWHECPDGKTMQLVPTVIHDACRHSGGVSEMKTRMAYGDIELPYDDE